MEYFDYGNLIRENAQLIQENEQLKNSKKEAFKWAYSLEKENAKLKERQKDILHFNFNLQNALHTSDMNEEEADYIIEKLENENKQLKEQYKMSEERQSNIEQDYKQKIEDMKSLADDYHILVDENINLKTKIVDHRTKEYRLLKILNETSDYT